MSFSMIFSNNLNISLKIKNHELGLTNEKYNCFKYMEIYVPKHISTMWSLLF
jgi:hypothetical protein